MKKSLHPIAIASTLVLLAAFWGGCPKAPLPPVEGPPAGPPARSGSFVAGVFQKFMRLGRIRLMAVGEKSEMFVGRFDSNGRTRWLKSYRTLADGRALAFNSGSEQLTVVGVFNETLNIDGRILTLMPAHGRSARTRCSSSPSMRKDRSRRQGTGQRETVRHTRPGSGGGDFRISIRTAGGFEVPGHTLRGAGEGLVLVVSAKGKILRAERARLDGPPAPNLLKAAPGKKACARGSLRVHAGDATAPACDYCDEPGPTATAPPAWATP